MKNNVLGTMMIILALYAIYRFITSGCFYSEYMDYCGVEGLIVTVVFTLVFMGGGIYLIRTK